MYVYIKDLGLLTHKKTQAAGLLLTVRPVNLKIPANCQLVGKVKRRSLERFTCLENGRLRAVYTPDAATEPLAALAKTQPYVAENSKMPRSLLVADGKVWIVAFNEELAAQEAYRSGYRVGLPDALGSWRELVALQKKNG